jgi:hypothetical protein
MRRPSGSFADPRKIAAEAAVVRKLVERLAVSSERKRGANLTSEQVELIVAVLRAYHRRLLPRPPTEPVASFEIEALDDLNLPRFVLASTLDESIAHAMFAKARRRFPVGLVVLRGTTSSGDRIAPVIRVGHRAISKSRARP